MKQIIFISTTIVLQFICLVSLGQQSELWLMNGKKISVENYSIDKTDYYDGRITFTTIKGKMKSKYKEDVFSIVDKSGNENILYKQNSDIGETLTPMQMKSYVLGLQDMQNTNISPMVGIGGFAAGLATAFIPQPEINFGENSLSIPVGVFIPITYVAIMGATPPNDEKLKKRLPNKSKDEYYLLGYQNGIRKKRIRNSLIGTGLGIISGFVIYGVAN